MGENSKCSNSTSTDRPTRPRSRSSSRKPASPIEPVAVDTRKGDQFKPEYLAINPNAKVPAIDDDGVTVFDSNAILLYLAEKTGKFLPANTPANRAELLSWLMFVATGVGPYSGQAVHFKHFAPEKIDYAHNRYQFEAQRHFGILNDHLANRRYMVGDTYTIVDMDVWGWARMIPFVLGEDAVAKYPNVKRLVDEIIGTACGGKGDRAEGQLQVQGRDGRRGPRQHVQAPQGQGRLTVQSSLEGSETSEARSWIDARKRAASGVTVSPRLTVRMLRITPAPSHVPLRFMRADPPPQGAGKAAASFRSAGNGPSTRSTSAESQYSLISLILPFSMRQTMQ